MATPPKVEIKRYRRFPGWDYSRGASLFITISTLPRRPLFGRIMAGKVELSPLGLIVRESLEQMPRLNPGILLFGYVVMPDHVHFNVHVDTELLNGRIVSLRVSREVRTSDQISAVVARMKNAVERGYVILSGYVSSGEKAVRDMLCALPEARFIRILPSCLPNARFKPESRYVGAFSEGRYLEIAKGNDEVEFGRAACLDYNAEIVEIANASAGGMALYWRADGVHRLGIAQPSSLARGPLSGVANLSCDVQTVSERKGVVLP